jgi:WD40 repeat protein/serine/threonine protein kinase
VSPETVFARAIEIESAQERAEFLEQACGSDPRLRREMEQLVADHFRAGAFLERPATQFATTAFEPAGEAPGAVIGPYKLLEQLGEGGMGMVFVADQTQPVRRRVALKVIKPGMDSRQVVARFEGERQALALMDHPNIARVLDGGETASGRPYFVMELVQGVPITQFCDDNGLTTRERLGLFVLVCQAVQHAHQKGIIHRDLKPSNVLVASRDGTPAVKVIDFGVAKAVGQQLTQKTVYTQLTQMVGTPLYMSPEQAGQSGLDIDTRADIYALGVLLYELLTGTTPLDKERLGAAAHDEIRRMIREEEPARPSTRVSALGQAAPAVCANRKSDPRGLSRLLRGELDWIVMKALEKDRDRRYETASAFAADVQRYLEDELVQAGPPGAGYRLRKLVKRHRGPVLAATVVLLALVAGIVGTTLGLVEADQARKDEVGQRHAADRSAARAKHEAEEAKAARDEAQRLAKKEKQERDRAERQLRRAEGLLYALQINLAQQAWEGNNAFLANHYLESCRRDFRGWEHDYLAALFNSNQLTLRGHTGEVSSVAVSPDGRHIVSGSGDGAVKVWDAATGRNTRTLRRNTLAVNTGVVFSVAMSPDGRHIASGNWDTMGEAMTVWDAATGRKTWTLRGGSLTGVLSVAFSPDGKSVVSGDLVGAVKLWDTATGREIRTLRGAGSVQRPNVRGVSGAERSLVFALYGAGAAHWPNDKGESRAVRGLVFSPDARHIVGCDYDGTVKVWDAATGKEIRTLRGHTGHRGSVAVSPDGKHLVSGGMDGTVRIWDAATGKEIRVLQGRTNAVTGVAFSPDGKRVGGGMNDGTLHIWDAEGEELRTFRGHTGVVTGVAWTPDGKRIVSGSQDQTVKIWDAAATQEPPTLQGHTGDLSGVAVSPDGTRIVSGSLDQTVKVWDAATAKEIRTLRGHTKAISGVAFSPDGKRVVSGGYDRAVKVWDADSGREIRTLGGHAAEVSFVTFSPDSKRVVSGGWDGTVKVWDAAGGAETRALKGYARGPSPTSRVYVHSVAVSPDGKRVVGGTNDGLVKVWDVATGEEIRSFKGHTGAVTCLSVSPDGRRIFSGSQDKTVKVWDADSGEEILTVKGHAHPVSSVALMPGGKRIVSGTDDGRVKVWDATTGIETLTLKGPPNFADCLAVSPDGRRIVCGSAFGPLTVWDAGVGQQKP